MSNKGFRASQGVVAIFSPAPPVGFVLGPSTDTTQAHIVAHSGPQRHAIGHPENFRSFLSARCD
jgi:hypothetical protein